MAKKQTAQWHKKHIPTHFGLVILAFLLLVTIILIPVLKQQQDSLIDAAGLSKSDQAIIKKHLSCTVGSLKGVCKQVTNISTGFFAAGHCPGSSAVQCYISSNVKCSTPVGPGTCHNTSNSAGSGKFVPGYCPGPSNVQCLVPHPTKQTSGGNSGSQVSNQCGRLGGTCMSTSTHKNGVGGTYYAGYCPGSATNQCWVPSTSSTGNGNGNGNGSGSTKGGSGSACGSGGTCVPAAICKTPQSGCHLISGTCAPTFVCNGKAVSQPAPVTPKCVASTQYYDGNTGGSVSVCTKWSPAKACSGHTQFVDGTTGNTVSVCTNWILSKVY